MEGLVCIRAILWKYYKFPRMANNQRSERVTVNSIGQYETRQYTNDLLVAWEKSIEFQTKHNRL